MFDQLIHKKMKKKKKKKLNKTSRRLIIVNVFSLYYSLITPIKPKTNNRKKIYVKLQEKKG